jgi:hypothetical protein
MGMTYQGILRSEEKKFFQKSIMQRLEHVLYPELRSDDWMPAGRSEAGYRKRIPDDTKMTGRPRMDASTTRVSYRVSVTIWPIERRG